MTGPYRRSLAALALRDGPVMGWLFTGLLCLFALTNSGIDTSEGDFALARHLLATGSLASDEPLGHIYARGPDGRFYASHDLGATLAMLPSAALGEFAARLRLDRPGEDVQRFLVSFNPAIYVALVCVGFFAAVRWGLGDNGRVAVTSALLLGCCTILWPYSRNLFEGVFAAVGLTWLLALLLAAETTGSAAAVVGAGVCLGSALITRQISVLFVPGALGLVGWVAWREQLAWRFAAGRVGLFLLAAAPFAAWVGYYNWLRTGAPWQTPLALPQYAVNNALDGNVLVGLAGLFFSPGKSVWLFSPILLAAIAGLVAFKRQRPAAWWLTVGSVAAFVLLHARLRSWSGDWGWGPRYLVPITPWLMLPAVWVVRRALSHPRDRAARLGLAALIGLSLVVQGAALTGNWHYRYAYLWQTGRLGPAVIWTASGGQLTDALTSAGRNLARLAGRDVPMDVVTAANPLNVRAANTLNVWWLTAVRAGAPIRLVASVVALLSMLVVLSGVRVWRATRPDSAPRSR